MTPKKINSVFKMYRKILEKEQISRKRMNVQQTYGSLSKQELLEHTHYLCYNALRENYAYIPEKIGKANRHLAAVQSFLGFAGWYTLEELQNHNKE